MAKLQLTWDLQIESFSEGGEDEVSLQFALLSAFDGQVRLDPHVTGNLFPSQARTGLILEPGSTDNEGRRIRASGLVAVPANVPTTSNPFLGFAARAVELDSSTDSNRAADNERFFAAVEASAQSAFDAGRTPTTGDLWRAGNGAEITDRGWWIFDPDDDDKVSTSVRVFPSFGNRLNQALAAERTTESGGFALPGPRESFELLFIGSNSHTNNARYRVQVVLHLVTNDGPSSSQSWY